MYTIIMIRKDLTILLDLYDKFYNINLEYYRDYLMKKNDKKLTLNNDKKKINNLCTLECYLFFKKIKIYEPGLINLVEYYCAFNLEKYIINIVHFLKIQNVHSEKKFTYKTAINLNNPKNITINSYCLTQNTMMYRKIFNKLFNRISFLKYSLQQTYNTIENNKVKIYNLNVVLNFIKSKKIKINLIVKNLEKKNVILSTDMKQYEKKLNVLLI